MNHTFRILKNKLTEGNFNLLNKFDSTFLEKSIITRQEKIKISNIEDYIEILENSKTEIFDLLNSLYINYSEFFRNTFAFTLIEKLVLPDLLIKKQNSLDNEIRIWSAASAAGQEAYSIAMICSELQSIYNNNVKFSIYATDILESELKKASIGLFNECCLKNLTINRFNQYFKKNNGQFKILNDLKNNLYFSLFDLTNPNCTVPDNCVFGCYDIIFCSNVLFYYNHETRQQIIEKLLYSLCPNGYIICDESEAEILRDCGLIELFPNSSIFQKKHKF